MNDHPKVHVDHLGRVDVGDGRHRISVAADLGHDIEVAVADKTVKNQIESKFK